MLDLERVQREENSQGHNGEQKKKRTWADETDNEPGRNKPEILAKKRPKTYHDRIKQPPPNKSELSETTEEISTMKSMKTAKKQISNPI